jgi:hypothetical protein
MNDRDIEDTRQPKDEPEQEYCEFCGQPMEYHCDRLDKRTKDEYWKCTNQFCPEKFIHSIDVFPYDVKVIMDMAQELVECRQSLKSAQDSLKYVRNRLAYVERVRQEREETIRILELVIENLTPSQSNVVVRDTTYQTKRMDDTIEFLEIGDHYDLSLIRQEWKEIKKILEVISND